MNWDQIEGVWKQRRGKAVRHWGKVMNDELAAIAGRYEELVGRMQENYGISTEEDALQVDKFKSMVERLKKSNNSLTAAQEALREEKKANTKRPRTKPSVRKRPRSKFAA